MYMETWKHGNMETYPNKYYSQTGEEGCGDIFTQCNRYVDTIQKVISSSCRHIGHFNLVGDIK